MKICYSPLFIRVRRGDLSGSSRRSPHPAAPAAWPRRPPSGLPQAYARSEVIEQHAEWVWGAAWKMEDRPAPKVLSLVSRGKFVLEGRARGIGWPCAVSKHGVVGVALNRLKNAPLGF